MYINLENQTRDSNLCSKRNRSVGGGFYDLATISLVKFGGLIIRCIFLNASSTLSFVRTIQRLDNLRPTQLGYGRFVSLAVATTTNNRLLLGMRQILMSKISWPMSCYYPSCKHSLSSTRSLHATQILDVFSLCRSRRVCCPYQAYYYY
jgi:hypothetical protein